MEFDEAVSYAENWMRKHLTGQDDVLAFDLVFTPKPPEPDASTKDFENYLIALAYGLEHGRKLTPENSVWLAKYLRGEIDLPKKATGRPTRDFGKSLAIADCVVSLVSKGLTASRNDENKNDEGKQSACDAVAFAMVRLKALPQSFNEIKKIYLEMNKLQREWAVEDAKLDQLDGVGAKAPD